MVTLHEEIRERVYAGVLGKLIGVYLGRAVEGWSYQAIRERFGEIANFVHHEVGMPLIGPDSQGADRNQSCICSQRDGHPESNRLGRAK